MAEPAGTTTDGRVLRKERSRQAVVEAILDLLSEGVPQPTAQQVAERSGVSLRSIFRIFEDIEALHASAIETQAARIAGLLVPLPHDGPARDRIRALVDNRTTVFEQIAPVRRLAMRLAPTSAVVAAELERSTGLFRDQVEAVFATELARRTGTARTELLDALDLAAGFEAWDALRSQRALPPARARRAVLATLHALTAS